VKIKPLLIVLAMASLLAPLSAPAQPAPTTGRPAGANLNISPKRVTFDRSHRSGSIYIFNQGSAAATFDISLVDRVMLPDGQIIAATEAQEKPETKVYADRLRSAQSILQVSPRRVTLNSGQGQTIRLRVTGAGDDPAVDELRSHLTIATLPPRESGTTAEEAAAASAGGNELRFQINALFGLSVPVIVRPNQLDSRAALENAHISYEAVGGSPTAPGPRMPILSFDLIRLGATSLFGNLDVRPVGQVKGEPIGVARGLGVYTEIDRRTVRIALTRAPAPGEQLQVTFTDDDTSPGKLLAKIVL